MNRDALEAAERAETDQAMAGRNARSMRVIKMRLAAAGYPDLSEGLDALLGLKAAHDELDARILAAERGSFGESPLADWPRPSDGRLVLDWCHGGPECECPDCEHRALELPVDRRAKRSRRICSCSGSTVRDLYSPAELEAAHADAAPLDYLRACELAASVPAGYRVKSMIPALDGSRIVVTYEPDPRMFVVEKTDGTEVALLRPEALRERES
jgi:hypothetical protein